MAARKYPAKQPETPAIKRARIAAELLAQVETAARADDLTVTLTCDRVRYLVEQLKMTSELETKVAGLISEVEDAEEMCWGYQAQYRATLDEKRVLEARAARALAVPRYGPHEEANSFVARKAGGWVKFNDVKKALQLPKEKQ